MWEENLTELATRESTMHATFDLCKWLNEQHDTGIVSPNAVVDELTQSCSMRAKNKHWRGSFVSGFRVRNPPQDTPITRYENQSDRGSAESDAIQSGWGGFSHCAIRGLTTQHLDSSFTLPAIDAFVTEIDALYRSTVGGEINGSSPSKMTKPSGPSCHRFEERYGKRFHIGNHRCVFDSNWICSAELPPAPAVAIPPPAIFPLPFAVTPIVFAEVAVEFASVTLNLAAAVAQIV